MARKRYQGYPQLVIDFLNYLETIRGKSKNTVYAYAIDLRLFLRFLTLYRAHAESYDELGTVPIEAIDVEFLRAVTLSEIYAFLAFLVDEKTDQAATRSRKISCLRSFFKYLTTKANLLEQNPCENLDSPKLRAALPKYLSLDEAVTLLSSVEGNSRERDLCILVFFLNCGMRLSELAGINLSSITENRLTVLGKGNKERTIYLNSACLEALRQYLDVRESRYQPKADQRDALFLNRLGGRISPRAIQNIVKKHLAAAGLADKNYSTHKLRHTAATLMFRDGGVDLRTLQEILGHAQLSTTQIYTHVSNQQVEEAAGRNPLAQLGCKELNQRRQKKNLAELTEKEGTD